MSVLKLPVGRGSECQATLASAVEDGVLLPPPNSRIEEDFSDRTAVLVSENPNKVTL